MSNNKIVKKLENNKESLKIVYKLAVDFLVIIIIATFFFLMAEGLIFGIASRNIGFVKIVFLIVSDILLIYILGNFLGINLEIKNKKKLLTILAFFLSLLILSGLIKINIFLALFIWLVVIITGFKIFRLFFETKN
jgi:hypothetical protein